MYWWEHLQTLRNEEVPVSRAELVKLLEAASKAVLEDAVWECSGIDNLLQRASQRARAECPHTARTEALALLGFHQQRNVLLSGISGTSSGSAADLQEQGKLSSGSASPSSDEDAAQPDAAVSLDAPASPTGHTLKRRRADAGSSATSTDHSFSVPSSQKRPRQEQQPQQPQQQGEEGFAVPRLLPRRRVTGAVGSMPTMYGLPHLSCPSISARGGAVLTQQSPQQHWCGPMNLHLEDFSSSELCQAQVQLPAGVSRHVLPPRLIFTHIVQRRGVTLGKHHVCRTCVTKANAEQAQSLRSMAVNELVAVSSTGATAFILVPYLDSKQMVKLAGFLLQF